MSEPVTISSKQVARGLDFSLEKVESVIKLLDEGYPVPFISRYRKDETGNLDETQIREVETRLNELRQLAERKQAILKAIEAIGKLTPELDQQIREARTSKRLEDLYLPYKPKRETLASTARSRGLEPLAMEILEGKLTQEQLDTRIKDFLNEDKGVKTEPDALLGAGHIIGEIFSENVDLRQKIRNTIQHSSKLISKRIEQEQPSEENAGETEKASPIVVTESAQTQAATAIAASFVISDIAESEAVFADTATIGEDLNVIEVLESPVPQADENSATENTITESETAETPSDISVTQDVVISEVAESEINVEMTISNTDVILPPAIAAAKAIKVEKKREKKEQKQRNRTPQEEKRLAELEKLYNDYFDFVSDLRKLLPYRVLAINRGEKAKVLRVRFEHDKDTIQKTIHDVCVPKDHPLAKFLEECAKDATQRLLLPALERETRRDLTESAENQAVEVFAKNLRNLLLQPPLNRQRVLAVDPGLKHGCKTVALDEFGNVLAYETVYIVGKSHQKSAAQETVTRMIEQYRLTVVAIGNGTGCREAERFIAGLIVDQLAGKGVGYIIVNESGASIYSASAAAKEEFPNYDALLRGAVSIGRRLQDPLNELVKIEPGHIGVGMYQHDVKAKHLQESLEKTVESCVNHVGVDLNRATPAILRYVAGLNQLTAKRIYEYRQQNGPFRTREQLKQVTGLGEVTFTYAAGFLKIKDGIIPLDATWIHPESYVAADKILQKFGFTEDDLRSGERITQIAETLKSADVEAISQELGIGQLAVSDIITQLGRPGRDPREELPSPIFKTGILKFEDLSLGTELTGTVLNVVDFGAFVDVGLHESGLVHISQMADHFVKNSHDLVSVGDVVKVWVTEIDQERKRISLSMLPPGTERKQEPREERRPRGEYRRNDRPPRNQTQDQTQPQSEQGDRPRGHFSNDRAPREREHHRRNDASRSEERGGAEQENANRTGGFREQHENRGNYSNRENRKNRRGNRNDGGKERTGENAVMEKTNEHSRIAVAPRPGERHEEHRGEKRNQTNHNEKHNENRNGDAEHGNRDGRRERFGNRNGGRDGNRRRTDRFSSPKSFEIPSKREKVVAPLSENMKKGVEPLRSFSDLAQFLGHIQPMNPEEEKRRKREERAAQRKKEAAQTESQKTELENIATETPSVESTSTEPIVASELPE
ncbi:MAG: helix-hairpin-helix domain-containing protein [Planctomycetaceae bacterium]|jgi:uncharacterized protein|nr:helix-hairpin-helix domain-containing protein [Planctomycetaceae bacterium]